MEGPFFFFKHFACFILITFFCNIVFFFFYLKCRCRQRKNRKIELQSLAGTSVTIWSFWLRQCRLPENAFDSEGGENLLCIPESRTPTWEFIGLKAMQPQLFASPAKTLPARVFLKKREKHTKKNKIIKACTVHLCSLLAAQGTTATTTVTIKKNIHKEQQILNFETQMSQSWNYLSLIAENRRHLQILMSDL